MRRRDDEPDVFVIGRLLTTTDRAYLIEEDETGEKMWIPKSQARDVDIEGDRIQFYIRAWIAHEKGLA